ncbi:MAG: hypothetical protein ACREQ9_19975, partial [Candidatus Binatia bacterium]
MIHHLLEFFRSPRTAGDFERETNATLLSRIRIGSLLALTFIPVFAPLDYLRLGEQFLAATAIRLFGCAFLGVLVVLTYRPFAERAATGLAAFGVAAISATIL